MHDPASSPGERLRSWRLRAGLTQEELAEKSGLAAGAVQALERGARRAPYPRTLSVLADGLGLSADERAAFVASAAPRAGAVAERPVGRSSPLPQSNVPALRTPLIGRADELARLGALLTDATTRLVTVSGVGGTGKTCLAVQVAENVRARFADGVWLVELAPLTEPELVPRTVAAVLGVPEGRDAPLEA
jgi:transcriptional regulator with XRE-family HTH domain